MNDILPDYLECGGRIYAVKKVPPPIVGGRARDCCVYSEIQEIHLSDQVPLDDVEQILEIALAKLRQFVKKRRPKEGFRGSSAG